MPSGASISSHSRARRRDSTDKKNRGSVNRFRGSNNTNINSDDEGYHSIESSGGISSSGGNNRGSINRSIGGRSRSNSGESHRSSTKNSSSKESSFISNNGGNSSGGEGNNNNNNRNSGRLFKRELQNNKNAALTEVKTRFQLETGTTSNSDNTPAYPPPEANNNSNKYSNKYNDPMESSIYNNRMNDDSYNSSSVATSHKSEGFFSTAEFNSDEFADDEEYITQRIKATEAAYLEALRDEERHNNNSKKKSSSNNSNNNETQLLENGDTNNNRKVFFSTKDEEFEVVESSDNINYINNSSTMRDSNNNNDNVVIESDLARQMKLRKSMESQDNSEGNNSLSIDQPIIKEFNAPPDEKYWNRPVSVKHPRTVLRKARLLAGKIVENPHVSLFIIILIIINSLMMGISTFDFVTDNTNVDNAFEAVDKSFLIIFTIECGLQLLYRGFSLFFDGWLVFDLLIVVSSWSLESLQIIRAFRIFRAIRLVTRVGPLRELILAIGAVMPRLYAISMLLLLVFYIYAVLFTQLYSELDELEFNYFKSLDQSLFTCMQLMTLEWVDVVREVMEYEPWAWLPFLSFVAISGFIVFNLIVAVVCDAVSVTEQNMKKEREGSETDITDAEKLSHAQERIYDLSLQVEQMKIQNVQLQRNVKTMAVQLQRSVAIIHKLQYNSNQNYDNNDDYDQQRPDYERTNNVSASSFATILRRNHKSFSDSDDNNNDNRRHSSIVKAIRMVQSNSNRSSSPEEENA